jgi:hypothetical protein
MGWFTKSKKSSNVSQAPHHETPWSTSAGSTASHGVNPPLLPQYQASQSPQYNYDQPGVHYEYQAPNLDTIDETTSSPVEEDNRRIGDMQVIEPPIERPGTSRDTLTDLDQSPAESRSTLPAGLESTAEQTSLSHHPTSTSVLVQPSVLPPTQTVTSPTVDSLSKPTCSLNLMCYRSGSQGCIRRQIQVASLARLTASTLDVSEKPWKENASMILNDRQFFHALHQEYEQHIRGFWRRYLSLKTLRRIRVLSYTPTTRPEVVPMHDFTLQEVFYAYQHPKSIETESEWIDWVFRLRQADRRHALEFVEDWSGFRIGIVGSVPWVVATLVGVTWTARGGDAQTAFTVAAFILTVGTCELNWSLR